MAKLVIRKSVDAAVIRIEALARKGDHEGAHALEDELYAAVLRAIVKSDREGLGSFVRRQNDVELAERALLTKRLKFRRECA